jgi:hypothetical protein
LEFWSSKGRSDDSANDERFIRLERLRQQKGWLYGNDTLRQNKRRIHFAPATKWRMAKTNAAQSMELRRSCCI